MSLSDDEDNTEIDPIISALRDKARSGNGTAIFSRIQNLKGNESKDGASSSTNGIERQAEIQALIEAAGIGTFSTSDGKKITDPGVLHRICSSVSGLEEAASKSRVEPQTSESSQDRTLVDACNKRDVSAVKSLLASGWSANEATDDGESLLSLACSSGQYELVEVLLCIPPFADESKYLTSPTGKDLRKKLTADYLELLKSQLTQVLLQHNANVEDCGTKGECTPLMEAASGGYGSVVQLLLRHNADVNATSSTGNTALTYACCGGFVDVVKILIDAGADLESHNENGHTPLMEASSGGHVNVAALLLDKGAGINTSSTEFKESALTLACYKGHLPMVKYLLRAGADQEHKTDEMHTALMEASMDGHVDVAKLLLDSGAQVNMPADSFESPLTLAACGGHVELAQLLIARGAALEEVNDEGYTAIMEASREGHEEMVSLLLSKGCNVNAKTEETQETALTLACCGGFLEVVELLVDGGADIELGSSTPLMESSQEGQLEVVKYLIGRGADVKATTKSEDTALHFACEQGHTDIAEVLLSRGADIEAKTECGRTPLMKASRAGHLCAVQYLIGRGANVNHVTNSNDHSVLSLACAFGHTNVVETLLCQGADPLYKLKDDSNMLIEASRNGHVSVVRLLLEFPENYVAVTPENQQSDGILHSSCDEHEDQLSNLSPGFQLDSNSCGEQVDPQFTPQADGCEEVFLEHMSEQAAEVVNRLIRHGSVLTQTAEGYLPPAAKEEVESDITLQIENFLKTMAKDPNVVLALVEGNCKELESRVMKAVEKQFYALYGDRSPELMRKILDEKNKEYENRGNPDGGDQGFLPVETATPPTASYTSSEEKLVNLVELKANSKHVGNGDHFEPNPSFHVINNGTSGGCVSQAQTENDTDYCQCNKLTCTNSPGKENEDIVASSSESSSRLLVPNYRQPDVDACTESNHDTPLTLACAGGHENLVDLLLLKGANIAHRDKKGFTPLILAATAGHVIVVQALLEVHADIEAQSERTKDTPLSLACSGGRVDVVEVLLQHGANKEHRNVSDYTPLSLAASGGYVVIIRLLLTHGAEINSRTGSKLGISPLMLAAMNGHAQAVLLLLDMGADINAQIETNRNTALTLACFQGRHEVVSLLVDRKANVEHRAKTGLTPLMEAASGGYAEVGRVLLDKNADPNAAPVPSSRDTALTIAADKGHFRFCDLILTRGAQVEVRNKKGNTSLWLACNGGHHEVVKLLVNKGADVNAADNRNVTPLMAAFRKGHIQVVRFLANVVSQFPSENECERFIASVSSEKDQELRNLLQQCKECIEQSKARQAEAANKFAANLLKEIDREQVNEQRKKAKQAKKREKKKLRKKKKIAKKSEEENKKDSEVGVEDVEENIAESSQVNSDQISEDVADSASRLIATDNDETPSSSPSTRTKKERLPTPPIEDIIAAAPPPKTPPPPRTPPLRYEKPPRVAKSPVSRALVKKLDESLRSLRLETKPVDVITRTEVSKSNSRVSSTSLSASTRLTPSRSIQSPSKRNQRREEGWKEVAAKKCSSNGLKLFVNSRLVSRLIGRAGCNINAIREATGAHIDIDKQRKGSTERTVTIKGSVESQNHAYNLITTIIREDGCDQDVQSIITRSLAMNQLNERPKNQQKPSTHVQVIAAPIPTKSAWKVPPATSSKSIAPWVMSSSSSSSNRNITTPSVVYTNSSLKTHTFEPLAPPTETKTSEKIVVNKEDTSRKLLSVDSSSDNVSETTSIGYDQPSPSETILSSPITTPDHPPNSLNQPTVILPSSATTISHNIFTKPTKSPEKPVHTVAPMISSKNLVRLSSVSTHTPTTYSMCVTLSGSDDTSPCISSSSLLRSNDDVLSKTHQIPLLPSSLKPTDVNPSASNPIIANLTNACPQFDTRKIEAENDSRNASFDNLTKVEVNNKMASRSMNRFITDVHSTGFPTIDVPTTTNESKFGNFYPNSNQLCWSNMNTISRDTIASDSQTSESSENEPKPQMKPIGNERRQNIKISAATSTPTSMVRNPIWPSYEPVSAWSPDTQTNNNQTARPTSTLSQSQIMLADVLRNQIPPQNNDCRNYLPKHSVEMNFSPSQSNYGPIGSGLGRGNRNSLIHHKQLNHHTSNVLPINNQYNHQYRAPPPAGYTLPITQHREQTSNAVHKMLSYPMPPQTISQMQRYPTPPSYEYSNDHFSQYNLSKNTANPSSSNDVNWQQRANYSRNKMLPHQTEMMPASIYPKMQNPPNGSGARGSQPPYNQLESYPPLSQDTNLFPGQSNTSYVSRENPILPPPSHCNDNEMYMRSGTGNAAPNQVNNMWRSNYRLPFTINPESLMNQHRQENPESWKNTNSSWSLQ